MIGKIIDALSAVSPVVGIRYGLCEKQGDTVYQYVGGGNGQPVNVDQNGSWSYFRITSTVKRQRDDSLKACEGWRYTVPLRYVLVTRRDGEICPTLDKVLSATASFAVAKRSVEVALHAQMVKIDRSDMELDTNRAAKNEIPGLTPHLEMVFQYADLTVEVLLDHECMDLCGPSGSILCELIEAASGAQILDCLSEAQIVDICGTPVPVDCPVDISANGDFLSTISDPCATPSVNFEVVDTLGAAAATSVVGGKVVVADLPCTTSSSRRRALIFGLR